MVELEVSNDVSAGSFVIRLDQGQSTALPPPYSEPEQTGAGELLSTDRACYWKGLHSLAESLSWQPLYAGPGSTGFALWLPIEEELLSLSSIVGEVTAWLYGTFWNNQQNTHPTGRDLSAQEPARGQGLVAACKTYDRTQPTSINCAALPVQAPKNPKNYQSSSFHGDHKTATSDSGTRSLRHGRSKHRKQPYKLNNLKKSNPPPSLYVTCKSCKKQLAFYQNQLCLSCQRRQGEQEETEHSEILEHIEEVLRTVRSGKAHDSENQMEQWLQALNNNATGILRADWYAARIERTLLFAEGGGDIASQWGKTDFRLSALRNWAPSLWTSLNKRWDIIRAKNVLDTLKSRAEHPMERRMPGILNAILHANPVLHRELNARWQTIRLERRFDYLASSEPRPYLEYNIPGILHSIRQADPESANRLSTRWDTIRLERRFDYLASSEPTPELELTIPGTLHSIRQTDPASANRLSTRWSIIQVVRTLNTSESGLIHPEENLIWSRLAIIQRTNPPSANALRARWWAVMLDRILNRVELNPGNTFTEQEILDIPIWVEALYTQGHPSYYSLTNRLYNCNWTGL